MTLSHRTYYLTPRALADRHAGCRRHSMLLCRGEMGEYTNFGCLPVAFKITLSCINYCTRTFLINFQTSLGFFGVPKLKVFLNIIIIVQSYGIN